MTVARTLLAPFLMLSGSLAIAVGCERRPSPADDGAPGLDQPATPAEDAGVTGQQEQRGEQQGQQQGQHGEGIGGGPATPGVDAAAGPQQQKPLGGHAPEKLPAHDGHYGTEDR